MWRHIVLYHLPWTILIINKPIVETYIDISSTISIISYFHVHLTPLKEPPTLATNLNNQP